MTIQDTVDALFGAVNDDDCLSRITFVDALSVPFVANVLQQALGDEVALPPDQDEEELRIEMLQAQADRLARQLTLVRDLRQQSITSPFLAFAQAELNTLGGRIPSAHSRLLALALGLP
ncbi:hypothetical protein HFO60_01255 [Rhizobium leguminosarum]|uniref:hypothetical protein n=1 Tax=Rhizobium leguminosarum TaxID=384 RepID=UPI001C9728B5|nr:hypothetical protein [Rhizobium leguminosarum]MBY5538708.1 hypothetical protein [Rhizobium leguminosarum]